MRADRLLLFRCDQWMSVDTELLHPALLYRHMPTLVAGLLGQRQFSGGVGRAADPFGTDFHNQLIDLGIEHQQLAHGCVVLGIVTSVSVCNMVGAS